MQIAQFQKRFKTIPHIIELDHLTVTGDVSFGRNVTLRGTVISKYLQSIHSLHRLTTTLVVANEGQKITIPDGCILENSESNLNCISLSTDSRERASFRKFDNDCE